MTHKLPKCTVQKNGCTQDAVIKIYEGREVVCASCWFYLEKRGLLNPKKNNIFYIDKFKVSNS